MHRIEVCIFSVFTDHSVVEKRLFMDLAVCYGTF